MKIKDFKTGNQVQFDCFISTITERETKKGEKFITISFKDDTGEISGNAWKTSLASFAFKPSQVVNVFGSIGEYEGKQQLNITNVQGSDRPITEFCKKSKKNPDEMFAKITKIISNIKTPLIKYLLEEMIINSKPLMELYIKAPAAKGVHHPWVHGLIEHVSGMCDMAEKIIPHYQEYYHVSVDKVMFGLIMHDLGKVIEYDFSTPNITYTKSGILNHHIGIAADLISRTYATYVTKSGEKETELLRELLHLVYSHHGQLEWGALVKPATIEAMLVHQLDYMDSKMMHIYEMIQQGVGDIKGMTKKSFIEQQSYLIP